MVICEIESSLTLKKFSWVCTISRWGFKVVIGVIDCPYLEWERCSPFVDTSKTSRPNGAITTSAATHSLTPNLNQIKPINWNKCVPDSQNNFHILDQDLFLISLFPIQVFRVYEITKWSTFTNFLSNYYQIILIILIKLHYLIQINMSSLLSPV